MSGYVMRTLIKAAQKRPASHLGLRARVIKHLPAPFQRRLWTLLCLYLLLRRHVQPIEIRGGGGERN